MSESNALFQLGIDLNRDSSSTQAEVLEFPVHAVHEEPHNAIEVLREAFTPTDIRVDEHRRGRGMV